jgi:hypothetical protein
MDWNSSQQYCSSNVFSTATLPIVRDTLTPMLLALNASVNWIGLYKNVSGPSTGNQDWVWTDGVSGIMRIPLWDFTSPQLHPNNSCGYINTNAVNVGNTLHACDSLSVNFFCEFSCKTYFLFNN